MIEFGTVARIDQPHQRGAARCRELAASARKHSPACGPLIRTTAMPAGG
jgi:hypothetical protein